MATALLLAMAASSCTYELAQEGATSTCGPLRFVINTNDAAISDVLVAEIGSAVVEFADLVGRDVENLGSTDAAAADYAAGDPILFELAWPDDAPTNLGYAEPHLIERTYEGGWVMLNPLVSRLPAGVLRRLVLHEMGHLHGLADVDATDEMMNPDLTVDDWGAGDLTGLLLTHAGGCEGATLVTALQSAVR